MWDACLQSLPLILQLSWHFLLVAWQRKKNSGERDKDICIRSTHIPLSSQMGRTCNRLEFVDQM